MNNADREIVVILKDIFKFKRVRPMQSDHNFRLWMIRSLFLLSVVSLLVRVVSEVNGVEITADFSAMINTPLAFFFTVLFLHINNEAKETSVIIFVLTWLSLMLTLYV